MNAIETFDGYVHIGESWDDVLTLWNDDDWTLWDQPTAFRASQASFAREWSGVEIETNGSAFDFLAECERAGLVTTIPNVTSERLNTGVQRMPLPRELHLQRLAERARAKEEQRQERARRAAERKNERRPNVKKG